jgi:hypothetical protein
MKIKHNQSHQFLELIISTKTAQKILIASERTGKTPEQWALERLVGQLSRFHIKDKELV